MALVQRMRESGKCPPSLIAEEKTLPVADGRFDAAAAAVLEGERGLALGSDMSVASDFQKLLQMAGSISEIPGELSDEQKKSVLEFRRCLILAIVGATPANNAPLKQILNNGFLVVVNSWLDDILKGSVGGVDLLLHMLSNVSGLPVTKSMVMSSGLGKAIGAIEKNPICAGSKNEAAIKERVRKVKEDWNASVKALRGKGEEKPSNKRALESPSDRSPGKKQKPSSSFSSLLKKVSTSSSASSPPSSKTSEKKNGATSAAEAARLKAQQRSAELIAKVASTEKKPADGDSTSKASDDADEKASKKQAAKRVKWADHFGGKLEAAREIEGMEPKVQPDGGEGGLPVSWSDRKKRDRLREKELMAKAKKSKIIDEEDELEPLPGMTISAPWHTPKRLPARDTVQEIKSSELVAQVTRQNSVTAAKYYSEADVPNSPAPLTDVEQAVDMASQSSVVTATIPFFAPQPEPSPVAAPAPAVTVPPPSAVPPLPPMQNTSFPPPSLPPVGAPPPVGIAPAVVGATAETVLAMGLPLFLVGSNVQALQTLAATPSLLSTFVDSNGMYDQPRLMNLVQTLSQNLAPAQTTQQVSSLGGYQQQTGLSTQPTAYQAKPPQTSGYSSSTYGPAGGGRNGYRGDQNNTEGNLHLSGYGLTTTQAEIIALFSPYVQVDEVVMKSGFSFVNTSDPAGAKRAKEALAGALLGGSPIRINIAQRRSRDAGTSSGAGAYGPPKASTSMVRNDAVPLPRNAYGQVDYEQVRDDRGNPATKNLFVAGYGAGTSELDLRNLFSQHATITGCVMKGTFSFVNTSDKTSAVNAREALTGSVLNGGVLRINFAKETGRLGTSFDTTYGPNARSPYSRPVPY